MALVRLSSLDRLQPPTYHRALYVWHTPHINSEEAWHAHAARVEAALAALVARELPVLGQELLRQLTPSDRGGLCVSHVTTQSPLVEFSQLPGWHPPSASLMSGAVGSWPLGQLEPSASHQRKVDFGEEPRVFFSRFTWCGGGGGGAGGTHVVCVVYLRRDVGDSHSLAVLMNRWAVFVGDSHSPPADSPAAEGGVELHHDPARFVGRVGPGEVAPPHGLQAPPMCAVFVPQPAVDASLEGEAAQAVNCRFRFSRASLDLMKADAERRHGLGSGRRYTDNDVIAAHLWPRMLTWRGAARAWPGPHKNEENKEGGEEEVSLVMAASLRERFDGAARATFGNCFVGAVCTLRRARVLGDPEPVVAAHVHQSVAPALHPAAVHRVLDFEATLSEREPGLFCPSPEAFYITNHVALAWGAGSGMFGDAGGAPVLCTLQPLEVSPRVAYLVPPPPAAGRVSNAVDVVVGVPTSLRARLLNERAFRGVFVGEM